MVDPTLLEAVGHLSSQQGAPTADTMQQARHLLGYATAYLLEPLFVSDEGLGKIR